MPHTCLFTGESLPVETKLEHTIPRSLGGRIRSRIVSSSTFNNSCSDIDNYLYDVYAEIMSILGPAISSEHRAGQIEVQVPGDQRSFVLDQGEFIQSGITMLASDLATKRPISAVGADVLKVSKKLKLASGKTGTPKLSRIRSTDSDHYTRGRWIIRPEIELAALKSALLAFDHILADDKRRFTRSDALAPVRTFVRDTISSKSVNPLLFHKHSLGIQYESMDSLLEFRANLFPGGQRFEHTLFATGNVATKTLDAVWIVAGFDPFGFRLSDHWEEYDFTCMVVNQILAEGTVHGPFWKNLPIHICKHTSRRSYFKSPTKSVGNAALKEISGRRQLAAREAMDYVERTCDLTLIRRLREITDDDPGAPRLVETAMIERANRLYRRTNNQVRDRSSVDAVVSRWTSELPSELRLQRTCNDLEREDADWQAWLPLYRQLLDLLADKFGLPGDVFTVSTDLAVDVADDRRLGTTPLDNLH